MENYYQDTNISPDIGFQIEFVTMRYNSPPHWHREIEILYILNGSATVIMEGKKYEIRPLDLIVIDCAIVHEVTYELPQTMGIRIHISKSHFSLNQPELEHQRMVCCAQTLAPRQTESYYRICGYLKDLTVLYFEQKAAYPLRSNALILEILAELAEHFSTPLPEGALALDATRTGRMEQVFQYVEEHYTGPISLQDAADAIGFNKEYFCRLFKKNTGMTFLQYISHVRLNHVYQDLIHTDTGIQEILERNGITSTKFFYKQFKETFHCTPGELKRLSRDNPYL
ncbi:MAG: AraC family transcriptional regulator [Clostridiales bacterium]|nr:AraC family transcriptional regulator [Clostridiales bacterium]